MTCRRSALVLFAILFVWTGRLDAAQEKKVFPQTRLAAYYLDLPADYDSLGEVRHPVVLILHGRGSNAARFAALARQLHLPDAIFVRVDAPYVIPGSADAFEYWPRSTQEQGGEHWRDEAARLAARWCGELLREVLRTTRADPRRVFVTGFSQGGALAYMTAMENPDLFAGAAPLAGFLLPAWGGPEYFELLARAEVALFIAHGSEDAVVDSDLARQARDAARAAGVTVSYRSYAVGHTVSEKMIEDLAAWIRERCNALSPN